MSYRLQFAPMVHLYRFLVLLTLMFGLTEAKAQVNAAFTVNLPNPACNPAVVGFTNNSTGLAPLSYQWNFGVYAGTNSVFENPFTTYLNCGTFTVTLIVTNGLGESDTATQDVTIHCTPVADFSVSSVVGCAPFTTTYTDLSTPNSGTIALVEWDFGDGFLGAGATATHTYYAIGCNTVTQIVTNSFGCKANKTVLSMICVQEPPVAAFTSTNPTSCAAPFDVTFTDATTGGTAPYSYVWNFTNANPDTDSTANPTVTFTNPGASGVSLTVTDANGCSSTVSNPAYVNIADNTVDFNGSPLQGCAPYVFQPLGTSNNTVQSWAWTVNPGGLSGSGQTPSFNLSTPGVYQVCLTATFSGACQATICKDVTVHQPPTAQFSVNGPDTTCMRPTTITFTNNSVGGGLSYSWSFPGGTPAASNDSVPAGISYSSCGTYNALLTVTDSNACTASASLNNILTIVCPDAQFTVAPQMGCVPLTASFNSSGSVGNNIVQYLWNFGDTASADNTSSDPNPSHTFENEGCYTVTLIIVTDEGCTDTLVMPNAVCAGTPPQVNFSVNPGIACADDPISFTNLSTNVNPYTVYIWDFLGVPPYDNMSNQPNPTYTYLDTGYFDVTLIASNYGCNDTLTIYDAVYLFPPVANIQLTRNCATPYVVNLSGLNSVGAHTYTWVIPGGTPSMATTPTVTVTYAASGNYSATLLVTNDSTGCDHQTSINIPIRDVQANFTGTPLQGCRPLTSCMNNTSVDAVSYQWTVYVAGTNTVVATSTQTNPCFTLNNPGVYDVRLIATDMFGCKDTLNRLSYITVWGPVVGFYGTPLQGCTPLFVQFTDTSSSPTSTLVSWSWNFGDPSSGAANTSNLQNPSHTYYYPGFYTVSLTVTDNYGCSRTVTKNHYVQAIKPNADFTLSKTSLCHGEIACFTNASSGAGLTYSWDFGNGETSTLTAPCVTYYANGSFDITLYVTDQYGCKDTVVKQNYVTITKPEANFVADTLNSTCPPLKVTFTNLSTDPTGITSYFWNFGDNSVSIAPNPVHIYNLPGSYTVTLIVTNANGCKDTLIIPNYINIGGPQGYVTTPVTSGCSPLTVCFTANAPTAQYFTWNFGDGTVMPDDDSVCYVYPLPGVYNPELILDDGLGCVYALPIGEITVGGVVSNLQTSADTLCGPGTVQFNSNATSYIGVASYSWNFGDPASGAQNTSSQANPSHYFGAVGTYTVTLTVTSIDGCVDYHTVQITVLPKPIAAFIASDYSVCPPSMISFTNQSTASFPIVSYLWNFGDPASGAANTSTFPNPSHFYTTAGTYTVSLTVTDEMGCSDVKTLNITVNPPLNLTLTPNQNICKGTGVVLSAGGAATYAWSPAVGLNATTNASVLANPTVTTTYSVIGTSVFGCTALGTVTVNVKPSPVIDSTKLVADTCATAMGSASVFVSDGTLPYSYLWNIGNTTNSISNVAGGFTYTVTVTDAQNCSVTAALNIPLLAPAVLTSVVTNATCESNNGAIVLNVNGGQAPFTYIWSNGATTKDISNVYAGSYSVTVTDALHCTSETYITVNNIASPVAAVSITNATCSVNNGIAQAVLSGGTSPFTYVWNTVQTTSTISNLSPGAYSVTVTDNNGCTATASDFLINIPGPSLSETHVNATCQTNNASVDLTISNGTYPMLINWNNGFSYNEDLNAIYSGNYSVTVTDANNCKDSLSVVITDTPVPAISVALTPATCGSSNGAIDVTVTAGVPAFTFAWSNGATTEDLNSVPAGIYTITVSSSNGCTVDSAIALNNINAPSLTTTVSDATCGLSNGSVSVNISGGTAPFTYLWSTGATDNTIGSLTPGAYSVTVTDGNNCLAYTTASLVNISGPDVNALPFNATCGLANGGVSLFLSGGTSPFTYVWSNASTQQNLSGVGSGMYAVTVTDNNGCTTVASQSVGNIDGAAIMITVVKPTCDHANGTINALVSGGTTPYTYLWSNGATASSITNVPEGIYSVTVTDANNCSTIEYINLQDMPEPELSLDGDQPTCGLNNGVIFSSVSGYDPFVYNWSNGSSNESVSSVGAGTYILTVTDVYGCTVSGTFVLSDNGAPQLNAVLQDATCGADNGSIDISISGGTMPYNYIWNNTSTTQDLNNLSTGLYFVTVTDYNGCTSSDNYFINNINGPALLLTATNTTCGLDNGAVNTMLFGGTAPFSYAWNTGATEASIHNLAPANYSVTITDGNGCNAIDSITVTPILGPFVNATVTHTTCTNNNGSIILDVTGGVSPYSFNWNNYTYITKDLINVPAGVYSVTITDVNGCQAILTDTILDAPGPGSLFLTATTSTCGAANGSAAVSVIGGTMPYSFIWNNAQTTDTIINLLSNTYSVTVTDANNCTINGSVTVPGADGPALSGVVTNTSCGADNGAIQISITNGTVPFTYVWSNGATTQDLNNLAAASYSITVTDANNCSVAANFNVDSIYGPYLSYTSVNTTCGLDNGSIDVTVNGGQAPFSYDWNNMSYNTQDLNNIGAGAYSLTLTDANNCVRTLDVVITNTPGPVTQIFGTPSTCGFFNGSAYVVANGGTAPYTYSWSNIPPSADSFAVNLAGNTTYSVTVTDDNNCTVVDSIFITNIAGPSVSNTSNGVSCSNGTGYINLNVSGGTPPFTYEWNNGATTQNLSNVGAGNYIVVVTDANGCQAISIRNINALPVMNVSVTPVMPSCNQDNGSIEVTVSGGVAPYNFIWNSGDTNNSLQNLSAGNYSFTITDFNACQQTDSVQLNALDAPVVTATSTNAHCGQNDGSASIEVQGGAAPYSITWSNGATTMSLTSIAAGAYSVTVADVNNCSLVTAVNVGTIDGPEVSLTVDDATCNQNNGAVFASISANYSYNVIWNTGSTEESILNIAAGTYTITVTDSVGCSVSAAATVATTNAPALDINTTAATCNTANGAIDVNVSGGTAPFVFNWSNGSTNNTINNLTIGTYYLTVTDQVMCSVTDSVVVTSVPVFSVTASSTPEACNQQNGTASLIINGTTAPYTIIWSNGATTTSINNLQAGAYQVTITDSLNCSHTEVVNIGNSGGPNITANVNDATCQNANGSINTNVNGGTNPYTYVWSNGATTSNLTALVPGAYTLTVTDAQGCSSTANFNVNGTPIPVVLINPVQPSCGLNNGSLSLDISGGTGGAYSIIWNNASTAATLNNLAQGTYFVTVQDAIGCTAANSIILNPSNAPVVTVSASDDSVCVNVPTTLTATGAVTYSWAPAQYLNATNASTVIATVSANTTFTVTGYDSTGCAASATVPVYVTAAPQTSVPAPAAICTGSTATINASGNYSFVWSGANIISNPNASSIQVQPAVTSTYSVQFTDANGCSNMDSVVVTVFNNPTVTADTTQICAGASAVLHASGANVYQWYNAAGNLIGNNASITVTPASSTYYTVIGTALTGCKDTAVAVVTVNPIPAVSISGLNNAYCLNAADVTLNATPAGGTFSGAAVNGNVFAASTLNAGTYTIQYAYTDSNGCSNNTSTNVTIYPLPVITANAGNPFICSGASVNLSATGAASYTWTPAASLNTTTGATVTATPTVATTYTVIGTDNNGCTASANTSVNVGGILALTISNNNPQICLGNSTTLTANGATSYFWSPATGLSATTGSSVTTSVTQTTTYTLTGIDANGCSGNSTAVVTVNPLPVVTATHDTGICYGTTATLQAFGASTYVWINGVNMQNGSSITVTPLANVTYQIIGTDANGCTGAASTSITVYANPNVSATSGKVCLGNATTLNANGAASYTWSPAVGLNNSTSNTVIASPTTSQTYTVIGTSAEGCTAVAYSTLTVDVPPVVSFSGLNLNYCLNNAPVALTGTPAGGTFSGPGVNGNIFYPQTAGVGGPYNIIYSYSDMNGCSAADTQQVTIFANPTVVVSNAAACAGQSVTLIANGALTYTWSPATGLSSTTGAIVTATLNNPVTYNIIGTGGNGCSAQTTASITINPNPQLAINNPNPEICSGASVNLLVTGANTYEWTPAAGLSSSTASQVTANALLSTTYTIVGTNTFGCTDTLIVPLTVNAAPSVVTGPDTVICAGQSVELMSASTSAVTWTPASSLNNPNINNPIASPSQTTTYTVVATGANGCTASDNVIVNVVNYPNIDISGGGTVCLGNSANLTAGGGFNYTWMPETYLNTTQGENVVSTPTDNITYTVTAQNAAGCVATDTVQIKVKKPITIEAQPGATICEGSSYQLSAFGTGNSYLWTPASGLDNPYSPFPTATPLQTTTYTVTTTDGVCFTASATAIVVVNPLPEITTEAQVIVVAGSETQLQATSNVPGATYLWTPATGLSCVTCSNPLANPTQPTTYTVTVTDSAGCRADAAVRIDFLCSEDGIYVPNAFTPNGDGKNDVFKIRGYGVSYISIFRVYSRWGELMFETTDISQGWDGTFKGEAQFPAVYVYYIEGVCTNNQKIVKQGNVTLIR